MTVFFFYFKIIVVIEMKKKLINPLKIGKNLKRCVDQMGYKVKDVQEYLCLECPQPIYRWFKGSTYPSIHHLYALSCLFGVSMNELIEEDERKEWGYRIYQMKEGKMTLENQEIL